VRRRRKMAAVISIVACLFLATTIFLTLRLSMEDAAPPHVVKAPVPAVAPTQNPPAPATGAKSASVQPRRSPRPARANTSAAGQEGFVALIAVDSSITQDDLRVVRLQLSGADLRLMGAPVAEDLSDRRLVADIVVANDGTPYAVRLVR